MAWFPHLEIKHEVQLTLRPWMNIELYSGIKPTQLHHSWLPLTRYSYKEFLASVHSIDQNLDPIRNTLK